MNNAKHRGARPGENRFKGSQELLVNSTIDEIEEVLAKLELQRIDFRNLTHLASYVADVVSMKRGESKKRMAVSTLLRSPEYRMRLEKYGSSVKEVPYVDKFKSLISNLELKELNDLRAERKRLLQCIEDNHILQKEGNHFQPPVEVSKTEDQLCRVISLLLEASAGQFSIDLNSGDIVNVWARSHKNRIVAPKELAKPYMEWYRAKSLLIKKMKGNCSE